MYKFGVEKMDYWENRYMEGGNSGEGSRGIHKDWKWAVLNNTIPNINNIIDVGCGDLAFMEGWMVPNYIGIDISETIIQKNREQYPNKQFIISSADIHIHGIKSDVVFCHDVLFHIIDENVYVNILKNLTKYSDNYISIYTWHTNPLKKWYCSKTKDNYQAYRDFMQYLHIFTDSGFELHSITNSAVNKYGAMYIFKKKKNNV